MIVFSLLKEKCSHQWYTLSLDTDKQSDGSTNHLPLLISTDIGRQSIYSSIPCYDPEVSLLSDSWLEHDECLPAAGGWCLSPAGKTSCPRITFLYSIFTENKIQPTETDLVICMVSYSTMKFFFFLVWETQFRSVYRFQKKKAKPEQSYIWWFPAVPSQLSLYSSRNVIEKVSVVHKLIISKSLLTGLIHLQSQISDSLRWWAEISVNHKCLVGGGAGGTLTSWAMCS